MQYRVTTSPQARVDLDRIAVYTRTQWGMAQERIVIQRIRQTVAYVSQFPLLAKKTDKADVYIKQVKGMPLGVVYHFSGKQIKILQILHDKQNRL